MELNLQSEVKNLAHLLNLLGEEVRLQIVLYLLDKKASVNEIIEHVNLSQPLVSHHLKVLKNANILKSTKEGKKVIYELKDLSVKTFLHNTIEESFIWR